MGRGDDNERAVIRMDSTCDHDGYCAGLVDRATASFRLAGDLDPDDVTRRTGITPSHTGRAGDALTAHPNAARRRQSQWSLAAVEAGRDTGRGLEDCLTELLDRLEPHSDIIREHLERGAQADVFCGLFLRCANRATEVSPRTLGRLAALGAALSIDIYGA